MTYSRLKRRRAKQLTTVKQALSVLSVGLVSLAAVKLSGAILKTDSTPIDTQVAMTKQTKQVESKNKKEPVNLAKPAVPKEAEISQEEAAVIQETAQAEFSQAAAQVVAPAAPAPASEVVQQMTQVYTPAPAPSAGQAIVLSNGNSAGAIGTEAAARMAAATGVPQSTWEYIIARESNGDPTVANPSGASGLFQTIPGWGSTATVEDQINTAIHVYNNQGLAAWGMQ